MAQTTAASTQQFIEISGIKDGVIVLKNGGYRMIFSVSAVNFSLKSEQEQNSIIFQYQSFLNSLHFPIQIVMRSKRLDLTAYVKKIAKIKDQQTNELIKIQAEDYIQYISELIGMANIMKKAFYVVIAYDPIMLKKPGVFDRIFSKEQPSANLKVSDAEFKRYRDKLIERANIVASGMGNMGLHCVQLTTEEIIELFYGIYNPEVADKERLEDTTNITGDVVANSQTKEPASQVEPETQGEEVIDNTALVEERSKADARAKEMADQNQAQRQMTAPAPQGAPAETQASATAGSQSSAQSQAQPVTSQAPAVGEQSPAPAPPPPPPATVVSTLPGTEPNQAQPAPANPIKHDKPVL